MSTTATRSTGRAEFTGCCSQAKAGAACRMPRQGGALEYHGRSQLAHRLRAAAAIERAFVSVRPDQVADPVRRAYPAGGRPAREPGPLAGIPPRRRLHPGVAWLVLACDLPFLDAHTGHPLGA